jgi:hypothetical protein
MMPFIIGEAFAHHSFLAEYDSSNISAQTK